MAFLIDESFLPAILTAPAMTDEQFAEFCAEHPDLMFEMTAEGELIVMAPTHFVSGIRNSQITRQLSDWADRDARGFAGDSSTGFVLPNGARRSPDASWTARGRINQDDVKGFAHLCPDFVIELKSKSDRSRTLRNKMREYLANGAQLGWLIDPEKRTVEIFRPDGEPELLSGIDSVAGEGPMAGFVLDLQLVWNPLR